MLRTLFVAVLLIGAAKPAQAQLLDLLTNPKIDVAIEHPASLPLKATTVALVDPQGECAEALLDRIEADFVQHGLAVVDRQQLKKIVAEHKLNVSGVVDQKTAAGVGQLIGAQALIFLKVLQCGAATSTEPFESINLIDKKKTNGTKYTTIAKISGSLRVVDLTFGQVLASQTIEGGASMQSTSGAPDHPRVIELAEHDAANSVHRMFLPWKEARSLVFYDDKECNLKMAYQQLRSKDVDGALSQSESNLEGCRGKKDVKPKVLAHAFYNFGMVQFIRGNYDAALGNLSESAKLQSGEIVVNAIADCRRAKEFAASMGKYESNQGTGSSATKKPPASVEERLQQLQDLRKKSLISEDEFNQKRAEILKSI